MGKVGRCRFGERIASVRRRVDLNGDAVAIEHRPDDPRNLRPVYQ